MEAGIAPGSNSEVCKGFSWPAVSHCVPQYNGPD